MTGSPHSSGDADSPLSAGDAGRGTVRRLDERGVRCPLPVIHLARLVRDDPLVERVVVLATDPAAAYDIPAWCRMRGHRFVEALEEGDHAAYVVDVVREPAGA